jgi:hypothetical protein
MEWLSVSGGSALQLCVFRVVLGGALLYKIVGDHVWGMFHYFDLKPRHLIRWRYETGNSPVTLILSPRCFKVFYVIRWIAVATLTVGILPQMSAAVIVGWCLFEFSFDRKFNTLFLGLVSIPFVFYGAAASQYSLTALLNAPDLNHFLAPQGNVVNVGVPWQQLVIVVMIFQVYWSSAWHKLRSRQFVSGDTLQKVFEQMALIQSELPRGHREYYFPKFFTSRFALGDAAQVARRWRVPSVATIALEAAIPVLLVFPTTWVVGAVAGAVMHAAFTTILPKRLIPFTLSTLGAYLLFLSPAHFVSLFYG